MADLNSNSLLGTEQASSGFNFDNVGRNARFMEIWANEASGKPGTDMLPPHGGHKKGPGHIPQATKTGTTIAGIVFKNGVVLGADTRATNGDEVADKNCEKIHYISDNMYCCGAGTAADTDHSTGLIASQLELLRMDMHATSSTSIRVISAVTRLRQMLFRYQGYVSAALILGGVDKIDGPQLYSIFPHGSSSRFSFTSMGSGCLAAMAVLETSWRPDMEEEDAVKLVQRAITAGIFNDLGSGSNCDITVIRTDGSVEINRPSLTPNNLEPLRAMVQRSARLNMNPGTTPILATSFIPHRPNMATLADVTVTAMEE